ncbi:HlyD family secretion protein [Shewanella gaetbuli]|uniref:HlyD family secretion protein n=1 Tax=Shewanella gaetbuli TaxID=220752 RepID=A0A9X2CK75_9GAMM|nr:HlyD family secretion protein [Shewanella gaetbuli]MCL1142831.1 HlyD family secretion protein [Shewanella gaetbuli]
MKYFITAFFVVCAVAVGYHQYQTYQQAPWTRDGQVRAHIIQITPRVTGQIVEMNVDDDCRVEQGDVLFQIDSKPYEADLKKAQAGERQAAAMVEKAKNEYKRQSNLERATPGAVPELTLNNLANAVDMAKADLALAQAQVDTAEMNLSYTTVIAPTSGFITNLNYRIGSQVVANAPVVALIDESSFWIEGFFKETDLNGVDVDDEVTVQLMKADQPLSGTVTSIGFGISKSDGSTGNALLPNVNPSFEWIRLAQRIPVKVKLDNVPAGLQLRVGMTASVQVFK